MRIAGIIAEYNPFHPGHAYHIQKTRERGATHIACVMSGNFVERGEPAIFAKEARVRAALAGGADLIIELPLPWAMAPAQTFARGGVFLLNALSCVDLLSFGSECGDLALLTACAKALSSKDFPLLLKEKLAAGLPFAKARAMAMEEVFPSLAAPLFSPNDTLALEYLADLSPLSPPIQPVCVRREGAGHDEAETAKGFASASFVRTRIREGDLDGAAAFLPPESFAVFQEELEAGRAPAGLCNLERAVLACLRTKTLEELTRLPDLSEGLENRLYDAVRKARSLEELYDLIKTKRYSHARIRRICLAGFLGLTGDLTREPPPYLRILGANGRGYEVLKRAGKSARLPIVGRYGQVPSLDKRAQIVFNLESRATDLFGLATPQVQPCGGEETYRLIKR